MQSAIQGVDGFMRGFHTVLDIAKQKTDEKRERVQLEVMEHNQGAHEVYEHNVKVLEAVEAKSNGWMKYAQQMQVKNAELERVNGSLREQLIEVGDNSMTYINMLRDKLESLNHTHQRNSADKYATEKMRDRLLEQIATATDPSQSELLNPETLIELHKKDWDYFMTTSNVQEYVPTMVDAYRKTSADKKTKPP